MHACFVDAMHCMATGGDGEGEGGPNGNTMGNIVRVGKPSAKSNRRVKRSKTTVPSRGFGPHPPGRGKVADGRVPSAKQVIPSNESITVRGSGAPPRPMHLDAEAGGDGDGGAGASIVSA
jgi:hypothetical protein